MNAEPGVKDLRQSWIEEEAAEPFVDPNDVPVEAPRYLFCAGTDILPERQRRNKRLRWGGMELESDYKCFSITKGHIWRNMLTPMVSGRELFDEQLIEDTARASAVTTVGSFGVVRTDFAIQRYPGEEIRTLLYGKSELPSKGLVEIRNLRNVSWVDVKKEGYQTFFFPDWEKWRRGAPMPTQLSWTRNRIAEAIKSTSDDFLRDIGENMLTSCENFYAWGINKLKIATTLTKTPPNPGSQHVYTYSEFEEQLFTILEQQREDYLRQDFATLANGIQFSDTNIQSQFMEQMQAIQQNQNLITQLLAVQQGVTLPTETVKVEKTLCAALKANNDPCGAPPMKDSEYCVFHNKPKEE